MSGRLAILIPGYNEPPEHLNYIQKGHAGRAGLEDAGYRCVTFAAKNDGLRLRIDRFAEFVAELRERYDPERLIVVGYSLGGLIARGYLLAYPERASQIAATVTIASPHWGVLEVSVPFIARALRVTGESMGDMALDSEFMRWLNDTGGSWAEGFPHPRWRLDAEPRIAPEGARLLSIVGLIPRRGGDNDGLVWRDSATLDGRIETRTITDPHANHMNLIGHFDPAVFLLKGFWRNDRIWPKVVRYVVEFCA